MQDEIELDIRHTTYCTLDKSWCPGKTEKQPRIHGNTTNCEGRFGNAGPMEAVCRAVLFVGYGAFSPKCPWPWLTSPLRWTTRGRGFAFHSIQRIKILAKYAHTYTLHSEREVPKNSKATTVHTNFSVRAYHFYLLALLFLSINLDNSLKKNVCNCFKDV